MVFFRKLLAVLSSGGHASSESVVRTLSFLGNGNGETCRSLVRFSDHWFAAVSGKSSLLRFSDAPQIVHVPNMKCIDFAFPHDDQSRLGVVGSIGEKTVVQFFGGTLSILDSQSFDGQVYEQQGPYVLLMDSDEETVSLLHLPTLKYTSLKTYDDGISMMALREDGASVVLSGYGKLDGFDRSGQPTFSTSANALGIDNSTSIHALTLSGDTVFLVESPSEGGSLFRLHVLTLAQEGDARTLHVRQSLDMLSVRPFALLPTSKGLWVACDDQSVVYLDMTVLPHSTRQIKLGGAYEQCVVHQDTLMFLKDQQLWQCTADSSVPQLVLPEEISDLTSLQVSGDRVLVLRGAALYAVL